MNRRHFLGAIGGAVLVGAAGAWSVDNVLVTDGTRPADAAGAGAAADESRRSSTATAAITRGDLGSRREFKATVSFGDPWPVAIAATGTVTGSHPAGTVVDHGAELVRIDDRPVFLAEGTMPLYRELRRVDTRARDENGDRLELQRGQDVTQLQAFLLAAGFDAGGALEADGVLGVGTEKATKAWQEAVGLPITGRVDATQVVFGPDPVRISSELRIGAAFATLEVNRAEASVLVDTSNRDRSALPVGGPVTIVLPDGSRTDGTVDTQEQVTAGDGSRVWRSTILAAGDLPAAASTATVEVHDLVAEDVLLVPASALLALAEGGFALELVDDNGATRLVRVEVGAVLDARAEVRGDDIAEGTTVVVPA